MDTSWVFNAFEAAWQDTGDDGLINYHVEDDRSYIGYIQIFVRVQSMYAINTLRRYAYNIKPYDWIIKIEPRGDYFSCEFYHESVRNNVY